MGELIIKNKKIGAGKPLICVPVIEQKKDEIIREIACLSGSVADIIEWRVDAFEAFEDYNAIRDILQSVAPFLQKKIFLYTFRTSKQGGLTEIDENTLSDLHDLAAESGCVDLVDLEYFAETHTVKKIKKMQEMGVHVIASHHDFEETPSPNVMNMLLEKMCIGGADIVKLAVMPKCHEDVLNLLAVTSNFCIENPDKPVITMSMGKLGSISRLCGETFGSCVTFGAHRAVSAPGQFKMEWLSEVIDVLHEAE